MARRSSGAPAGADDAGIVTSPVRVSAAGDAPATQAPASEVVASGAAANDRGRIRARVEGNSPGERVGRERTTLHLYPPGSVAVG
jgi:hypothetical protein